jgi:hypothetical protein
MVPRETILAKLLISKQSIYSKKIKIIKLRGVKKV